MPILTVNQVQYNVEVYGNGEPLVLLHGFTGSTENWTPLVLKLTAQYQLILVDILGHGKTDSPSDPARYQIETVAQDLYDIFQSLELHRPSLLGYSMGGRLALYFAIAYPQTIKKLFLESASPGLLTETEQEERITWDNEIADGIEYHGVEAFIDYWEQLPLWESQVQLSQDIRNRLRQQRLANNPIGLANSLRGMGTGIQPSLWNELSSLNIPVHLIVGEFDTKFVQIANQMNELLPQSTLNVIEGAGHTVHLEQSSQFLSYLVD